MNFLSCDGVWLLQGDGSTVCQGQLKTFTVQEMRDYLTPSLSIAQKVEITGAILGLLVCVWCLKTVMRTVPH